MYISETRLKTFEEALDQHVQAVANNVEGAALRKAQLENEMAMAALETTAELEIKLTPIEKTQLNNEQRNHRARTAKPIW